MLLVVIAHGMQRNINCNVAKAIIDTVNKIFGLPSYHMAFIMNKQMIYFVSLTLTTHVFFGSGDSCRGWSVLQFCEYFFSSISYLIIVICHLLPDALPTYVI